MGDYGRIRQAGGSLSRHPLPDIATNVTSVGKVDVFAFPPYLVANASWRSLAVYTEV